ncbi:MAG: peptidoglycan DD-metalloendopeptidase family protein [Aestuariivita sp.]|nr:peptidoglycan DD-metalloendopeptidase family protein [Aestuariivita sp.]MCY4345241.1 peptidoglycan DD-metalloendopeptidase family protein [Aestuariivita sp.]
MTRRIQLASILSLSMLGIAACALSPDIDIRSNLGGFSTAEAARTNITDRPDADSRGLISYPNFQFVVAREGDTVETVARRINVGTRDLAQYNSIPSDTALRKGEILSLPYPVDPSTPENSQPLDLETLASRALNDTPTESGHSAISDTETGDYPIRHRVERGETAYTIARLYRVPVQSLASWNGLDSNFSVREGQYLLILDSNQDSEAPDNPEIVTTEISSPGAGTLTPTPPSAQKPLPDTAAENIETPAAAPEAFLDTTASSSAAMAMPVRGKVIRDFEKGKSDSIVLSAEPASPVKAAADGTVVAITSDANRVPIVIVRHPNNIMSVYANLDEIMIRNGDTVKKGQQIARLREEPNSYLHFEIREGLEAVDPTNYLP